jgi:hypothetical protein
MNTFKIKDFFNKSETLLFQSTQLVVITELEEQILKDFFKTFS